MSTANSVALLWSRYYLLLYLASYLFIFASSSVFIRALVCCSLAALLLKAHPLPFYEGQMHYFRLGPSYASLWKMVRVPFNILICLLPAHSLWLLRGFHHPVFDILFLEHLFLVSTLGCSHDGWQWKPTTLGNLPYLPRRGCLPLKCESCPKHCHDAVNQSKSMWRNLLWNHFCPGKIKWLPAASGTKWIFYWNIFVAAVDLSFLLRKSSFESLSHCSSRHAFSWLTGPSPLMCILSPNLLIFQVFEINLVEWKDYSLQNNKTGLHL